MTPEELVVTVSIVKVEMDEITNLKELREL